MYYRYHLEITTGFPLATATWASQINYDASPMYSQPIVLSGSTTAHTYTQLHSGTTYHVRVRALTTAPLGDSPATYGASLYSHPAVGSTTTTPTRYEGCFIISYL